jgi:L-lactate utilization protein LutB
MDQHAKKALDLKIEQTIKALKENNIVACYVPDKASALAKVQELLHEGDTVSNGGSMTLRETGVIDLLRSGRYNYLDRDAEGITPEQREEIHRKAFFADSYLCSSNAVTMEGELFNIDAHSNRTAAILFGPKQVIMVVGCNKIVHNLDEAVARLKSTAVPANAIRLSCDTYCAKKGACVSITQGDNGLAAGCKGAGRICCNYVVCSYQRNKDRIKVILVGEELGY